MKSIIYSEKGQCFLCERYGQTEEHHIFGASNRAISEKYGLKIQICPECHRGNEGIHGKKCKEELKKGLKMMGQRAFEKHYAEKKYKTKEPEWFYDRSPREKFMQLFGRNYL